MINLTELESLNHILNCLIDLELDCSDLLTDDVNPSLDDYLLDLEQWERK